MDEMTMLRRDLRLEDGRCGRLDYRMLRDVLLTREGLPVGEVYGVAVCQELEGQTVSCRLENVTVSGDALLRYLQLLADGLVLPDNAGEVLEDLLAAETSFP